jgi:signal peptidase II
MNDFLNQNTQTERLDRKSFGFWLAIFIAAVALTQVIRVFVLHFSVTHFLNDKFAFSINIPLIVIYAIYILVMIAIILFLKKEWTKISSSKKLGFIFIIAGGAANIFERIIFGQVTDYIFILNGVLNLADLYIIFGVLCVLIDREIFKRI